jgi:hypothetical protein
MSLIKVTNIQFDTDGNKSLNKSLRNQYKEMYFIVDDDFDPEEEIADAVSDQTGFCIFKCEFETITPINITTLTCG